MESKTDKTDIHYQVTKSHLFYNRGSETVWMNRRIKLVCIPQYSKICAHMHQISQNNWPGE